jgi:outer membrane biosynthesis protein TonB
VNAEEPALGFAAIRAVRSWQFEIPRKKGKPVDALIEVPVVFAAHGSL